MLLKTFKKIRDEQIRDKQNRDKQGLPVPIWKCFPNYTYFNLPVWLECNPGVLFFIQGFLLGFNLKKPNIMI